MKRTRTVETVETNGYLYYFLGGVVVGLLLMAVALDILYLHKMGFL